MVRVSGKMLGAMSVSSQQFLLSNIFLAVDLDLSPVLDVVTPVAVLVLVVLTPWLAVVTVLTTSSAFV